MSALPGLDCVAASLVTVFQIAGLTHLEQQPGPAQSYAGSAQVSVLLLRKLTESLAQPSI